MKTRNLFKMMTVAIFGISIGSCTGDLPDTAGQELPEGQYPLAFTAGMEEMTTRATADNSWDGTEHVAVQAVASGNPDWAAAPIKEYHAASNGELTSTDPYYWQSTAESKSVRAWYHAGMTTFASVPADFQVRGNQEGNSTVGGSPVSNYQLSDFLFAPVTQMSFTDNLTHNLSFLHRTAKVVINIVNDGIITSADDITSVTLGDATYGICLKGNFNGNMQLAPDNTVTGIVTPKKMGSPSGAGYAATYAALVIPQNFTTGNFICIQASNGSTYYYSPDPGDAELKEGKSHIYNITVVNDRLEVSVQQDQAWQGGTEENVTSYISYQASDLKPGDFYYNDGSHSDGGLRRINEDGKFEIDPNVTAVGGKTCVGIVYWVGNPCSPNPGSSFSGENYDKLLAHDYPGCTHGLVVSLTEEANCVWDASYQDVSGWFESNKGSYADYQSLNGWGSSGGLSSLGNTIMGYNNTRVLSAFNSFHSSTQVLSDAFVYLSGLPSVVGGSGWYFPSVKELSLMCSGDYSGDIWNIESNESLDNRLKVRNLLNIQFSKVGGSVLQNGYYCSSSEDRANDAFIVYFSKGIVGYGNRDDSCPVRGVLAF